MKKTRIDKLLVDLGLAETPGQAAAMIMAGVVLADERRIDKPSEMIDGDAAIRIKDSVASQKYASRAGEKLSAALDHFHIRPDAYICLDVGSSTGGFTDCLLQRGAAKVYAVDSGTNQMIWRLRNDERVDLREQTNARELRPENFPTLMDLIVMDVSFISATKIIPVLVPLMKPDGKLIVLIKPQFEAARGEVGEGGIIRDAAQQQAIVDDVNAFAKSRGLRCIGTIESPILGQKGNKEFLSCYEIEKSGQ
jgi:23S rRNA (cytidine1920-2'-O)/16S rRNA (cytidine1409-2'-O)-methyltransferase